MTKAKNRNEKEWITLIALQFVAVLGFAQNAYFVDGYHGGIYGHYPKEYTRFITETLDKNPDWNINLEIEPETWDSVQAAEPANYQIFKKYFNDDQSVTSRIEYVNPAYGQPYMYSIGGESIIRQFQYGIKKLRQHFPNASFTTYSSEEPCFTSALPQLLRSFGFRYASLKNPNTCWGGYTRAFGGELVNWIGPDGTPILTVPRYEAEALATTSTWQTIAFDNSSKYLDAAFKQGIKNPVGMCLQDAGWKNGPWLGKAARAHPTRYITWRNYLNNIATATPVDWYFTQEDVQVSLVWGAQVLQQIAKQVRVSENKTAAAEKLAAMAALYNGVPYPPRDFDEAWRGILLAQHHDCWIVPYNGKKGHTWIDKVGRWTRKTDSLDDVSNSRSLQGLTNSQPGNNDYVRVFNTALNARKELVKVAMPKGYKPELVSIHNEHGKEVSSQAFGADSIAFFASVPPVGYATYRLVKRAVNSHQANNIRKQRDGTYILESDLYRLVIDPANGGTISSLVAKKLAGKEFVDTADLAGFNSLRGYFFKDTATFISRENAATVQIEADGPIYSKISIRGTINNQPFEQTIALTRGQPAIDMSVRIDWHSNPGIGNSYKQTGGYRPEDYRKAFYDERDKLQTLFPLNLANQQLYKNAPFDVTKSKLTNTLFQTWDSIKHNVLLNWVDITDGDGNYGCALFSDHTTSYAHGHNYPLGLTTQYAGVGLWGRNYSVTGPTELRYALVPHAGKWDNADLWTINTNWNDPLIATTFRGAAQTVDLTRSMISASGKSLELTATLLEGKDLVVRFFNAGNRKTDQAITFDGIAERIITEELSGEQKKELKPKLVRGKTAVGLTVPAFGIYTVRLVNFKANRR